MLKILVLELVVTLSLLVNEFIEKMFLNKCLDLYKKIINYISAKKYFVCRKKRHPQSQLSS